MVAIDKHLNIPAFGQQDVKSGGFNATSANYTKGNDDDVKCKDGYTKGFDGTSSWNTVASSWQHAGSDFGTAAGVNFHHDKDNIGNILSGGKDIT